MLIINRALARELSTATLAIAFIFVALFTVVNLVKILAKAAAGSFPVKFVFTMLGLQTVEVLSILLPLSFYIGLIMTLTRWYRDSEMAVLHGCGISLGQLLRPIMAMALVFALLVSALSFYLSPLALQLISRIKQDEGARYETAAISPGVFNDFQRAEHPGDAGVYYVEEIRGNGEMRRVFAATRHLGRQGVLVAKTGREVAGNTPDERYLVLSDGVRYEGVPGQADYRTIVFEHYRIRIETPPPSVRFTPFYAMSTGELLADSRPGAAAEWHWRISKPVALLVLVLFGVVLSFTNPRQGRYVSLFVAILAYFIYSNLLGFVDAQIKRGRIPGGVGLWWVHALFLALGLYLFWRRFQNRPLLAMPGVFRRGG